MTQKHSINLTPATIEQLDIYNTDFSLVTILVIKALAGTGKTTALIQLARQYPDKTFLYVALNNSIVAEVGLSLKKAGITNVVFKTIHAYAHSVTEDFRKNRKIKKVTVEFVKKYLDLHVNDDFQAFSIIKMLGVYCSQSLPLLDFETNLLSKTVIDESYKKMNTSLKVSTLDGMKKILIGFEDGSIDFMTHDAYLKNFIDNQKLIEEDFLMVDEGQDLNDAMYSFVETQIELGVPNIVAVGDQNQSVYGFIGSKDVMGLLHKKYGAVIKTLTKSFRFAAKSDMEMFANQFLSLRGDVIYGAAVHEDDVIRNRAFLGRTNMQILSKCIDLIKNKESFSLLGGIRSIDFETINDVWYLSGLKNFPDNVDKIKSEMVKSFKTKNELKSWAVEHEFSEYVGACNAVDKMFAWKQDEDLQEVLEESGVNQMRMSFPKKISALINAYSKKSSETLISTFHKSKGLGVDYVEIMKQDSYKSEVKPVLPYGLLQEKNPEFRGNKDIELIDNLFTSKDGQIGYLLKSDPKQTMLFDEYNLMYVAVTRAKKRMSVYDQRLVVSANFISNLFKSFSNDNLVTVQLSSRSLECHPVLCSVNSDLSVKFFVPKTVASDFLANVQQRS